MGEAGIEGQSRRAGERVCSGERGSVAAVVPEASPAGARRPLRGCHSHSSWAARADPSPFFVSLLMEDSIR